MLDTSRVHFNFGLLIRELEKRGIGLDYIGSSDIVEARLGDHLEYLFKSETRLIPSVYYFLFSDKLYIKHILKEKGFPVAAGVAFSKDQADEALAFASGTLKFPAVIKPTEGTHGDFVYADIRSGSEFRMFFAEISRQASVRDILVERHIADSHDYRFFAVKGAEIAVVRRTPPEITGDGRSTVRELVETENHKRMNPRKNCLCRIYIDDLEAKRVLERQGMTDASVPGKGEKVKLRLHSNVCYGGECEDVTDLVHPSYFEVVKRILDLFPGMPFLGVDLLIKDPAGPSNGCNYVVSEIDVNPGFSLHLLPSKGKPRNVLSPLADLLFPETAAAGTEGEKK